MAASASEWFSVHSLALAATKSLCQDGRIWMLVRDRQGRLWESISADGHRWPALSASNFISSDSPAEIKRLRDGRAVLFTNSCQFWADPRTYAMGGRDVLHAAITSDDGKTWSGFREVLHESVIATGGDRGTGYPSVAESRDGKLVLVSGQGEGKHAIVLLDPAWLEEKEVKDDLSHGPTAWNQYGDDGLRSVEVEGGGSAVAIPLKSSGACGASWSFPVGAAGEVRMHLRVPRGVHTLRLVLNDHFTRIDDPKAHEHAVYAADLGDGKSSTADEWPKQAGTSSRSWRAQRSRPYPRARFSTPSHAFDEARIVPGASAYTRPRSGRQRNSRLILFLATALTALTLCAADRRAISPTLQFAVVPGEAEGGAVLGAGVSGAFDDSWVSCPTVVVEAGGRHRMWYSSWFTPGFGETGIGVATSTDGVRWTRVRGSSPVFRPGPAGAFDEGCVMGPEVLFDGSRYLMWYTGSTMVKHASGFFSYRIGVASSRDGIAWTRENEGRPVIDLGPAGSPDEVQAATPSVLRDGHGYRMWYAAWAPQPNHTICVARSSDGIHWERENGGRSVEGLIPATAFGPAVCRLRGGYLMLFMSLDPRRALFAARSDDGFRWQMLNGGAPVIVPSGDGHARHLVGHPALRIERGRLRAWTTGYDRRGGKLADLKLAIGLYEAVLP